MVSTTPNILYTFIGNILWTAFIKQGPSNVLSDLFSPTSLLYMKLTAFGALLLGFFAPFTITLRVIILKLLPFFRGKKDRMEAALKEKFGKHLQPMPGKIAIYAQ